MNDLLMALIGALAGGAFIFLAVAFEKNADRRSRRSHNASILYHDLQSIYYYIWSRYQWEAAHVRQSQLNIRYNADWQSRIANCDFIKDEHVQLLYWIYDNVYDYNQAFSEGSSHDLERSKTNLMNAMIQDKAKYVELINKLEKYIMGRRR